VSHELITTAKRLARYGARRPRQSDLCRAISTAYYAMFHTLAKDCADRLIGTGARRSNPAWLQVYRALDHGFAKQACQRVGKLGFPRDIVNFANTFESLQIERHRADYDPTARYTRAEVLLTITEAERAIEGLRKVARQDRTAFAALVLLKTRPR
jgi:uncharacterized protein (UPF0332 family)